MNEDLSTALSAFAKEGSVREHARALLGALGYRSERTADVGSVEDFLNLLDEGKGKPLTARQRGLFGHWRSAGIVFQVTADEISRHPGTRRGFERGRVESFLFVAADLDDRRHGRTELADMARAVNRGFPMPAILLLRHGEGLTLGAVHRRVHRLDDSRDVLERATLVKDIDVRRPHGAHLKILGDLALPRLLDDGVRDFEGLHAAWERTLDIEALNRHFYRELFDWFRRAVNESSFPDDGAGDGSGERHAIRLVTRLLFIWFMKEKGLVPGELFEEEFAEGALKQHAPDRTDYYRAVLQNLFFATLNTEIGKRVFSPTGGAGDLDFNRCRYRDLLADPDEFLERLKSVPFVNGGLFDCLDGFDSGGTAGRLVDAFTDGPGSGRLLDVPARLFLDESDGLFPLFRRYKFTVEENTPLDREVALDPELLGRTFENLLAAYNPETRETARRATGTYYTPRRVVDYMVREALAEALAAASPEDGDAEFWRERLQYLLDHSDAMNDADELFECEEKRAVVTAIAALKTLDPAVGSGAFPMGILQTLTLALRRLDPDNALWMELQKERAKARAGEAFDERDRKRREETLREISDTFERYGRSDFGRKLYLIQNCIYGVDIQPIACQIAKLRFFISLVIEQDTDPGAPNLGIKPLPNLETRFVAADSLVGLRKERSEFLLDQFGAKEIQGKIAAVRERHFLAGSRDEKRKCIKEERRLRASLKELLADKRWELAERTRRDIETTSALFPNPRDRELQRERRQREMASDLCRFDNDHKDVRMVADWDPYDQNASAGWFAPEFMFGVLDGFDVVIGNPPYIQLQADGGRLGDRYEDAGYETFTRTGDIYQLFYERGCGLLAAGTGTLAYITSNSWLKAKYGRPLRRWLAKCHRPLRLVEMGKDVFDAIVDTAVLIVRNGKGKPVTCRAVDVEQAPDDCFPPPRGDWGTLKLEGERPWMTLSSIERAIMEKMEAVGTPLKDWDISIYYGIKTGYNDAFIVGQETRDALVAADSRSAELLKPILRGRDIARYRANWADLWLISTFPSLGLDIDEYPAVKRHLLKFGKPRLEQSGRSLPGGGRSRKRTPHEWFELQDTCAYHEKFTAIKLLWKDMSGTGCFAYSDKEIYTNDKAFLMTGPQLKYLCAILNSSVASWYVSKTGLTTGMGLTQWKKYVVESIPVPDPGRLEQQFVDVVDSILQDQRDNDGEAEMEIDQLAFSLYRLTQGEQHEILSITQQRTPKFLNSLRKQ